MSMNVHRRYLTTSQRAFIAAQLATLKWGQRQSGKFAAVSTQEDAAKLLNVSERSVRSAAVARLRSRLGDINAFLVYYLGRSLP